MKLISEMPYTKLIDYATKTVLLGFTIVVLITWFFAFFNNYHVTISINDSGEAFFELVIMIIAIILSLRFVVKGWKP